MIVDVIGKNFVLITGPKKLTGVKRRRVNIKHIEPLPDMIKISRGASDDDIIEALKTSGKLEALAGNVEVKSQVST